jgi:hypothetical protein
MQRLTLIAKKLFSKDTRDLVRAEILNKDLSVKNTEFVLAFVVSHFTKELAVEARARLNEKEEIEKADEE